MGTVCKPPSLSFFRTLVSYVIGMCAKEEVRRPNTGRIIAVMQYA